MKAPAFQLYVRDWLCSLTIKRMSGDETKAFIYLLCWSWLETPRATLPDDDGQLAAMSNLTEEGWQRVKGGVMRGFKLVDGRWQNERLHSVSGQQEKFAAWGKMGGNPNLRLNPPVKPTHKGRSNLASSSSTASSSDTDSNPVSLAPKRRLTDGWMERWSKAHGKPYVFGGAKDGKAADTLLATRLEVDEILAIAEKAWALNGKHDFERTWAIQLSSFASQFNRIRDAVGDLGRSKTTEKISHQSKW